MGRYKPNGIPWKGKSAVVPIAAIDDMKKMNHHWNWILLEEIERTCYSDNEPVMLYNDKWHVFRCSECHEQVNLCYCKKPNYCPNCGSKVIR